MTMFRSKMKINKPLHPSFYEVWSSDAEEIINMRFQFEENLICSFEWDFWQFFLVSTNLQYILVIICEPLKGWRRKECFLILSFQIGNAVIKTIRNLVTSVGFGANCQERNLAWGATFRSFNLLEGRWGIWRGDIEERGVPFHVLGLLKPLSLRLASVTIKGIKGRCQEKKHSYPDRWPQLVGDTPRFPPTIFE